MQHFKTALMIGHDAIGGWSGKGPCLDHLATSQAKKTLYHICFHHIRALQNTTETQLIAVFASVAIAEFSHSCHNALFIYHQI
jgi:hypothetical protein